MVRIGILGTDNSHSIAFSRLFNVKGADVHVPGGKVVAIFGLDEARNKEVAEQGNVPEIVKRPADMFGKIDAAIVDFRHGGLHCQYALPFIKAGIPTFVDKPFAISLTDARKMVEAAKRKHTPITSFSTVRLGPPAEDMKKAMKDIGKISSGIISGPGSSHSEYAGVFFYGVHTVEILLAVFGSKVDSVRAVEHNGSTVAVVTYRTGQVVTLNIFDKARVPFEGVAFGEKGQARYDRTKGLPPYYYGMQTFLKMVKTGKPPIPYDELLLSVRILNAIQKSMDNDGKRIVLK